MKHFFPSLKVMGEESAESMSDIKVHMTPDMLDIEFISDTLLDESLAHRATFNTAMKEWYKDEIWSEFS